MSNDTSESETEHDNVLTELLDYDDTELVATPIDTHKLSLNTGYESAPRNPLCPVCEDQIRPISNQAERRFVCGCEQIWQFTFDPLENGGKEE